jgi:hypothetical protein
MLRIPPHSIPLTSLANVLVITVCTCCIFVILFLYLHCFTSQCLLFVWMKGHATTQVVSHQPFTMKTQVQSLARPRQI